MSPAVKSVGRFARVSRCANAAAAFALLVVAPGCAGTGAAMPTAPPGVAMQSITVTSTAFPVNGAIPVDYTCDGKDLLPGLTLSSPPDHTRALAIVVDDPDATSGTFTHFLAYDLSADLRTFKDAFDPATAGGKVGKNDFGSVRYNGPCPPHGEEHRYEFHVYALDKALGLPEGATRADVDAAMSQHVLGAGTLVGSFGH